MENLNPEYEIRCWQGRYLPFYRGEPLLSPGQKEVMGLPSEILAREALLAHSHLLDPSSDYSFAGMLDLLGRYSEIFQSLRKPDPGLEQDFDQDRLWQGMYALRFQGGIVDYVHPLEKLGLPWREVPSVRHAHIIKAQIADYGIAETVFLEALKQENLLLAGCLFLNRDMDVHSLSRLAVVPNSERLSLKLWQSDYLKTRGEIWLKQKLALFQYLRLGLQARRESKA